MFAVRVQHDAGGLTVRDRIAHKVVHREAQSAGPAPDGADVFDLHHDFHRTARPQVLPGHPIQQVGDVDELSVLGLRQLARGKLSERGDDRLHPALRARKVLHHLGELLGGQVVDAQRVQVRAHRRQRRAQFVSGVGGEILGGLQRVGGGQLGGGQPAQHRGHRLRQVLCLAHTTHFGHVVAALTQSLRVLGQFAQRPDRRASQQPAKARGKQHGSHARPPRTAESALGSTGCCRRGCRSTSAPRPPDRRAGSAPGTPRR